MRVIEKILKENILDKNTVFVFNTDIASNSWSDFAILQDGKDGWPASLETERFLAWDAFKGQALKIRKEGYESIPSLLRKFFARSLLERIRSGEKIFERLINSDYKENALSFTDWLSNLLPSLGRWRALVSPLLKDGAFIGERNNAENRDCLKLYDEYSKFLEEKKLFEPAWLEAAFEGGGQKKFIVFFPELLDDYDEYKEVLEKAQKDGAVRLVPLPQKQEEIKAAYWRNARLELRITALKILRERKAGTEWTDMALCVPDIENLRPYVERELGLYQIPFVTRSGLKLGKSGAGRIFRKFQDCVQNNFSYQSVRALVLDANIPWKNPEIMELLVRLGKEAKCLVQYTDSTGKIVDPWLSDIREFAKKESSEEEFLEAKKLYSSLKAAVEKIAAAPSFQKIKEAWKKFEETFIIPANEISKEANNILSRAVALLDELSALEKKFPEVAKSQGQNYSFFLNELENTQYQPIAKQRGLSVFDYKVSAEAAIKKQFVINASQDKITVEKLPLSFLSKKERQFLLDESGSDHSEAYVRAYAACSDTVFSAAQEALDGFAISHSALAANEKPLEGDQELEKDDFIKNEKDFLAQKKSSLEELSQAQKNSFDRYLLRNEGGEFLSAIDQNIEKKEYLAKAIEKKTMEERGKSDGSQDKIHITASDMKNFFPCPQKWIFKDLLRVNEFSLDTELFERYDQGSVNHKILELYFESLKGRALPVSDPASGKLVLDNDWNYEEKSLLPLLEGFSLTAFSESDSYQKSGLAREALKSQNKIFSRAIIKFLRGFCAVEKFGGWTVLETEWGKGKDIDLPPVLQGRMDLVLAAPGGEIAIVDYKNTVSSIPKGALILKGGEANPDGSPKELDDFQMAAYVYIWENNSGGEKISKASFVSVNNFSETKVFEPKTSNRSRTLQRENFDESLKSLERCLAKMKESLEERKFSLDKVSRYSDCASCQFNSICRSNY